MANLKELRLRINSVKNTRKITAAMSQIAAARLRRAQNAVAAVEPYTNELGAMLTAVLRTDVDLSHPLLTPREVARTQLLVLTADRGLCGAFNGNVQRASLALVQEETKAGRAIEVVTLGNKGASFFGRSEHLLARHPGPTPENLTALAQEIGGNAVQSFQDGSCDRVVLISNRFVSVLSQEVRHTQLLPVIAPDAPEGAAACKVEPNARAVLDKLVPVVVDATLQAAMAHSIAAEIAARRVAMDAATDNASQMIAELTLEYNRERQAAITKELMEIIGGSEALKG